MKNDTEVKNQAVLNIFEVINKASGVKLALNSFDKDFIESLNYKMIGRNPTKEGEIVIEKRLQNR